MDRRQGVDRFHLDDHLAFHEKIQAETDVQPLIAVMDGNGDLPFHRQPGPDQIACEAMLVNGLQQARPEFSVHGECSIHDGATDLIHLW